MQEAVAEEEAVAVAPPAAVAVDPPTPTSLPVAPPAAVAVAEDVRPTPTTPTAEEEEAVAVDPADRWAQPRCLAQSAV